MMFDTRGKIINNAMPSVATAKETAPITQTKKNIFGNLIPNESSHRMPLAYRKISFKTKMTGILLFTFVGGVYSYTMYSLRQEDFGDVLVPDTLKDKVHAEKS